MHLAGLFIYPVKSLRGLTVTSVGLDSLGLEGDRRFLLVDDAGKFLTQRTLPRMAQIETGLEQGRLILRNPHHSSIAVMRNEPGPEVSVQVWKDLVTAVDCGVEIAVWLSDFLRHPCRLVRIGDHHNRPVRKSAAQPSDQLSFADGAPLLLVSESSLADLNDRLIARGAEPVPMDRFRPNLIISGAAPYAEDTWSSLRIGDIRFRTAGPSDRCLVTTTDQRSGERAGKEPLRTLATYRRNPLDPAQVYFGQNLIHETKSGLIRLGDAVSPD